MRLSPEEIAEATGRPAPKKDAPTTRTEAAHAALGELDRRMSDLAAKHRQIGETHQQATARLFAENPDLYSEHKAAKAGILKAHGLGADAATGGVGAVA